jgi:hypothetical protein
MTIGERSVVLSEVEQMPKKVHLFRATPYSEICELEFPAAQAAGIHRGRMNDRDLMSVAGDD